MTPEKLKTAMIKLDFTTHDVSILMGVTRRAVQLWLTGQNPIPQSCVLVLMALLDDKVTLEWLVDQIAPRSSMN
jgi:transcriptional regulator with XRE-family HTH domain